MSRSVYSSSRPDQETLEATRSNRKSTEVAAVCYPTTDLVPLPELHGRTAFVLAVRPGSAAENRCFIELLHLLAHVQSQEKGGEQAET